MIFTVLGSGTTVPDAQRGPAGFLIQLADGRAFLVDGGSGTLQRCARAGVDPRELDGGFYTHRHLDHCADLAPLLFSMRHGDRPRTRDYPLWAALGFGAYLEKLRGVYGSWLTPGRGELVLHELPTDAPHALDLGGIALRSAPAVHAPDALHLRWDADGCSVVFSGDTARSDALVTLADGADLLVCECAAPDDAPMEGHMTPSDVADLVAAARPREVWLTHLYPAMDPALAVSIVARTGVPVRRAADGDRWSPR